MTMPDLSPDSLRAIYNDAKQLRTQLDALIARLQPLLEAAPTATAPADTTIKAATPAAPAPLPTNTITGPLVIVAGAADKSQLLNPLGLSIEGRPLLEIDAKASAAFAKNSFSAESKDQINLFKAKRRSESESHLGVTADIKAADLDQARWAVVINAFEDAALIQAVWPLIEHRMKQMKLTPPAVSFNPGENAVSWLSRHTDGGKLNLKDHWGQIPPVMIYRPGDRPAQWLGRYNVAAGPVDPRRGVPYYLLILGRPGALHEADEAFIPMNFQYILDIFWGVGRLCFTDTDGRHRLKDYTTYAEKLINFELAKDAESRLLKEVVYWSTKHEADIATIRSTNELATPLTMWHQNPSNTPQKHGFGLRSFFEDQATRDALGGVLSGSGQGKAPAILFTASHGLGLPLGDARLPVHQGALITQDWSGVGGVKRDHYLAGEDLGDSTRVEGMFACLFACYGAGCPDRDEFIFDPSIGPEQGRPQIARFSLIAQLPQQLLVRGALGVLGHVERAWTFSFTGTEDRVTGQSQAFEDVLGRVMQGKRFGDALDPFNTIQGDRAMTLTEELENIKFGKQVDDLEIARLWMARNDARNYALLGDPAARLPFASAG